MADRLLLKWIKKTVHKKVAYGKAVIELTDISGSLTENVTLEKAFVVSYEQCFDGEKGAREFSLLLRGLDHLEDVYGESFRKESTFIIPDAKVPLAFRAMNTEYASTSQKGDALTISEIMGMSLKRLETVLNVIGAVIFNALLTADEFKELLKQISLEELENGLKNFCFIKNQVSNVSLKENISLYQKAIEDEIMKRKQGDINEIWDEITIQRIMVLHPSIRQDVVDFILDVQKKGINLRIADGYRSIEEQNSLYEQGRSKPGNIVTNAKGGSSYHNYGLAVDVYEIKNGEVIWERLPEWVVSIAETSGFEWGGRWTDPYDAPHFQMTFGYSIKELLNKVNAGQTDEEGYVKIE